MASEDSFVRSNWAAPVSNRCVPIIKYYQRSCNIVDPFVGCDDWKAETSNLLPDNTLDILQSMRLISNVLERKLRSRTCNV